MAGIIKVLLFRKETDLACYLTAFYEIYLDDETIKSAIEFGHFNWLKYLYAFNKNYIGHINTVKLADAKQFKLNELFGLIGKQYKGHPNSEHIVKREI